MATVIQVEMEDLRRVLSSDQRSTEGGFYRGLRRAMERCRGVMVKRTPVDQGQLRAGWRVHNTKESSELRNDAPHAGIVETGSRPHKVSAEGWLAIYQWVYRHRADFGLGRKKKSTLSRGPVKTTSPGVIAGNTQLDPDISDITWAIVRKIKREGTKPTFFVRDSLELLNGIITGMIDSEIIKPRGSKDGK